MQQFFQTRITHFPRSLYGVKLVNEPLCPQCHLYLFHSSHKKLKSFTLLSVIVLCNLYLLGLRNVWQLLFHVSVASISTVLSLTRKLQDRTNDCGV